jgi:hypothetical protein
MKKNKSSQLFGAKKKHSSEASTVITNMIKLTALIPAYLSLKYSSTCCACKKPLPVGAKAFYFKELKRCVCFACSIPEWKAPGTPYDIRYQMAMEHKENKQLLKSVISLLEEKKEEK